ncbi:hypothetical protein BG004_005532 [Podila humilis]|nr:hypothetical protein BG004_005532 [Podila humilis]
MSPSSAKAQPMSISQLCQQDPSDDELNRRDLAHDSFELNSDDDMERHTNHHTNGSNGNGHITSNGSGYRHHGYSNNNSSDEFEEYEDRNTRSSNAVGPDPAEQLAAEALGDMANSLPPSTSAAQPAAPFIYRMSSLPIVNSALKAYETGKQNSKVMKYGADLVESGVKSLSKPVLDKLEPKLGQLDDFACRQLDKLEKVYPNKNDAQVLPSPTNSARSSNDILRPEPGTNGSGTFYPYRSRGDSIDSTSSIASSRQSFDVLRSRNPRHEDVTLRQRSDSQSSQRSFQFGQPASGGHYPQERQQSQQQVGVVSTAPSQQFSGWRGVVATVGTASAAGVAIFSEESMKSLKYCLQWLQYAVQHIDHQIGLLRAFLVSLANPSQETAMVPSNAASTLASIKKEVVETLRKVINVVSRYAGACLPDQAKINVRQFILSMPVRWATLNNESVPATPIGSPSLRPSDRRPEEVAALNETSERATKVLVLAHESSDMLKSVASIFKDSVDKAENWMDKLRYVGVNPQNNSEGLPSWAPTGFPNSPGSMPGGFPSSGASSSTGLEQYSLRQTQMPSSNGTKGNGHSANMNGSPSTSLKSSPRMGGRGDGINSAHQRHAYRQTTVMSGDEDSGSEETEMILDDSEDDGRMANNSSNGHAPLKRSMGSSTFTQDSAVRRRKKRGESAEEVAGLGLSVKQEPN